MLALQSGRSFMPHGTYHGGHPGFGYMERARVPTSSNVNISPRISQDAAYPFNKVAGAFGLYMVAQANLEASLMENHDPTEHRRVLEGAEKLVNEIFENFDTLAPGAQQLVQVLANQVQWSSLASSSGSDGRGEPSKPLLALQK